MFTSPIGRLRFFLYSVVLGISELIAIVCCYAATMGFHGFVNSKPGSSRLGLALACFVVMMLFAAVRANITWCRGKDAALNKWLIVGYLVLLGCNPLLQAGALLVYDVKTGNGLSGLSMLNISLLGLWATFCVTKSKAGGGFDPDSFLAAEGYGGAPGGGRIRPAATPGGSAAAVMTAPVAVSTGGRSSAGAIEFGRRGRA